MQKGFGWTLLATLIFAASASANCDTQPVSVAPTVILLRYTDTFVENYGVTSTGQIIPTESPSREKVKGVLNFKYKLLDCVAFGLMLSSDSLDRKDFGTGITFSWLGFDITAGRYWDKFKALSGVTQGRTVIEPQDAEIKVRNMPAWFIGFGIPLDFHQSTKSEKSK